MNTFEPVSNQRDPDSFDVRRSWEGLKQACWGHKLLIATTTLLTVALVVAYMVIWPPVYVADVTVAGDPEDDTQREQFYQFWNVFRRDHLPDEALFITSAPIIERVVDDLGLTYDDVYHPFLTYAAYLWTESSVGKTYRRMKEKVFPPEKTPYDPTPEEIDRARTIHDFKRGVALESVPETNVGRLVVKGPSARVAQVANKMIEVYLDERQLRYVHEAETAYESLAEEAEKAGAELLSLEQQMEDYYTENGLLLMFERDKVEIAQWLELKGAIVDAESVIAGLQTTLAEVNAQLGSEDREITSASVYQKNVLRENLRDRLSQLQLTRNQTVQRYRSDSPEVLEIDAQIATVEAMIAKEQDLIESQSTRALSETYEALRQRKGLIESELQGALAGLAVKKEGLAELETRVVDIPERMKRAHEMGRRHDVLEKTYMVLQEKLMMAAASKATARSAPPSMRIVESAVPPEKQYWPKKKLLLVLAVGIGLFSGVALALLVDLVYARVNETLRDQGEFPIYAILDQDKGFARKLFALSHRN